MKVTITTVCEATLTETWTAEVPDEWTDEQITEAFDGWGYDPADANEGAMSNLACVDEQADDEHDREIRSIER